MSEVRAVGARGRVVRLLLLSVCLLALTKARGVAKRCLRGLVSSSAETCPCWHGRASSDPATGFWILSVPPLNSVLGRPHPGLSFLHL